MHHTTLILVDGMRPDAMLACGHPYVKELLKNSAYTLCAQTVYPSVTLPCHMSLFHSVDPMRHGTTTNVYAPQVRPVPGLCEVLRAQDKKAAFFYTWGELRDLTRPDSLAYSFFSSQYQKPIADAVTDAVENAAAYIPKENPDFSFVYIGLPDEIGHLHGWMSEPYIQSIHTAFNWIQQLIQHMPSDQDIVIMADHGGHDRLHGTTEPEDMTIPVIFHGPDFTPGELTQAISILDIAPTIAALISVAAEKSWEGHALFCK